MKALLFVLVLGFSAVSGAQAQSATITAEPDKTKKTFLVEAACGQCRLGLPGKSCDLAIRLNQTAYFVDGTSIDSHGDAHARDGFCQAIRQAMVQGEIVNNRFQATYFQLVPVAAGGK
jgi:hypothetical protein